jgi:membrane fusion protein (multidrug efflux system)
MAEKEKKQTAEVVEEKEQKQKPKGIKRTITFILVVILLILAGAYFINEMQYVSTDDAYVETTMVSVAPKVSGQIEEVYVTDNQHVNAGDLVAIIDDADYRVKLAQADANYEKIKFDQENAKANLVASQSNITLAQKDLERYQNLYEQGAVSKQTLDAAQVKYDSAKAGLTQAQQALFSDKNGKTVADANLMTAKAAKDKATLDLSYTKIYAPQTGTVSSRRVEKGMYVNVGTPLFTLVPEKVWVVANFKENQLRHMKKGQKVDIKIDTYPNKIFKGEIDSIQRASGAKSSLFPPENAVGSFVKIVQRIPVKIIFTEKIDPEEYNIVPGMSVVPKVKVK